MSHSGLTLSVLEETLVLRIRMCHESRLECKWADNKFSKTVYVDVVVPLILVLERQRQMSLYEFKTSLVYIESFRPGIENKSLF